MNKAQKLLSMIEGNDLQSAIDYIENVTGDNWIHSLFTGMYGGDPAVPFGWSDFLSYFDSKKISGFIQAAVKQGLISQSDINKYPIDDPKGQNARELVVKIRDAGFKNPKEFDKVYTKAGIGNLADDLVSTANDMMDD